MASYNSNKPTAPPLRPATSFDPSTGFLRTEIKAAFSLFDKDASGTIDKAELYDILTYKGSGRESSIGLTDALARQIIAEFDTNGDGILDLEEFAAAISTIGTDIKQNEEYINNLYDRRAEPHAEAIKELFDKLDTDEDGLLSTNELRDVIEFYEGAEFDEAAFVAWYETNHEVRIKRGGYIRMDEVMKATQKDGKLDVIEFGWYVVEQATCEADKMQEVIEGLGDAIDYVAMKRATAEADA